MKKIISILLICIVLFMCSAYASAEGGLRNATVSLSFKGETAYCECLVREADCCEPEYHLFAPEDSRAS